MKYILVLCTTNDKDTAKNLAYTLVKEKLAACTNIMPKLTSIYTWKDEIVEDEEFLLIIKTKDSLFDKVKTRITELHNYEVAEIISIDIKDGSKPYLDWIEKETL